MITRNRFTENKLILFMVLVITYTLFILWIVGTDKEEEGISVLELFKELLWKCYL